ncbi:hypothetical protein GA0070609_0895 [Micromonospora echinaurantiaca]|uniref:Uncharacterized protein n=1 Tax=Micromonospora echinaurantiaca TaxID=47857 RepID=A0A1C5H3Q5_9ACTN|nr:hypothetical protein [Micromonospora echinaurantiaca]SCG40533.1 hypothetical protein GA0070609_0895 [Micromonospora echinaurantiaca]
MSVDELRAGLARIAETVVPDEDPYDRLMRHARRRRRRRFAGLWAAAAAVLAAALAGPAALTAAGLDGRPDDGTPALHGFPVDSEWTWRLINSPTRGSLAGDRAFLSELTRRAGRDGDRLFMSAELSTVKVLWADDTAGFRSVVLAYHSDTHAGLVTLEAEVGASPRDLVRGDSQANLEPAAFTVLETNHGTEQNWLLGLAPSGCTVSYARSAQLWSGVQRRWQTAPGGDHMLVEPALARGWWRVECDGQLRQAGPIAIQHDTVETRWAGKDDPRDGRPNPAPTADWRTARGADTAYRKLVDGSGLVGGVMPPEVRWVGRLDSRDAVLVGPPGDGPLVLQLGSGEGGRLALSGPGEARPDISRIEGFGPDRTPLVATGTGVAYDLAAVRVPAPVNGHAALTDRLLVVPRREAVRVEAVADGQVGATAEVRGGAALLTLPLGAQVTLRAVDGDGKVVGSGTLREPANGERIFNESLVWNW